MISIFNQFGIIVTILIIFFSVGCQRSPVSSQAPQSLEGSWTIYTPYDWTHDGKPYQSFYCSIYSDAAGDEMKRKLGEIADDKFSRILNLFGLTDISDFVYPPGNSKIEIYINRNHPENIAWAYWGGFIITIRSPKISGHWYNYSLYTTGHELTHIFEFLIQGTELPGSEVWFKEGIAVHIGCTGNTVFKTIENLAELESWISENQNAPGKGNPIKIHQIEDFPQDADWSRYYQLFELAVRYILDQRGLGKSYQEVLNLFYDLKEGMPFPVSFENRFGISVSEYDNNFYDRMRIYLNHS